MVCPVEPNCTIQYIIICLAMRIITLAPHRLMTVLLAATVVSAVTFVREPNNRGPSAVQAGRECLTRVARSYFNSTKVSRTRNMVVMHSARMSAPAADIEVLFLAEMHAVIASNSWKGCVCLGAMCVCVTSEWFK